MCVSTQQLSFPNNDYAVIVFEGSRGYAIRIYNESQQLICHAGYCKDPEEAETLAKAIYQIP